MPSHLFFFFNDTATTEISPLSLHAALPISRPLRKTPPARPRQGRRRPARSKRGAPGGAGGPAQRATARRNVATSFTRAFRSDRKSTRLNSSHSQISYAVFCLKKKKRRTPAS